MSVVGPGLLMPGQVQPTDCMCCWTLLLPGPAERVLFLLGPVQRTIAERRRKRDIERETFPSPKVAVKEILSSEVRCIALPTEFTEMFRTTFLK